MLFEATAVGARGYKRQFWIVDAHRDGRRFVMHADEKLATFPELESAIPACGESA